MSLKPRRVDFNQTWNDLRNTIEDVITLGRVERNEWNSRFVDIYTICVAHPEPLADKLYAVTKSFLEEHVKNLLNTKVTPSSLCTTESNLGNDLLHRYHEVWLEYSKGVEYLNYLYLYLNQQHIKKQKLSEVEVVYGCITHDVHEQLEIGELGLDIWRQHMVEIISETLVKQLLEGIQKDRLQESQPTDIARTIKGAIQSFVCVEEYKKKDALQLYQAIFEVPLLKDSGEFYKHEANRLLQQCTVSSYMEEVIKKLEEENRRALKYLHSSSVVKIRKECEQRMITDHLDFLYSECDRMVSSEKRSDLKNMYTILKPIPDGLKLFVQTFLEHIRSEGMQMISALKGDLIHIQFVEGMLKVHGKYDELITDTFKSDPIFFSALDKACASVINSRFYEKQPCRSAELVARYCDSLLKKSKTTESEIDSKITKSITIFKYIEDKDVYQKFYSRMLAKRLIHDQSQSMDAEEMMINKLKQACGYEFTNKLHRMFTDISVSSDLNQKFNHFLKQQNKEIGINVSIKILQAGAWPLGPTQQTQGFTVPQEFEKPVRLFEKFYHVNFSGRKLTWLHHLCHGELKIALSNKNYIVTMQTYQMAILLLFESADCIFLKEIQESLQLNYEMLQKHVSSLMESKLLMCDEEVIGENSRVVLNKEYSNKRTKFKITAALQKDTPQEQEKKPCLLYGYGGFNICIQPSFSITGLVFIDSFDGILAYPNIRGGGEYGERWHNAGRLLKKQNVFDDFQYAAQYLVESGYTSHDQIVIQGGSNGGLLVGACINQRPDLFGAAVAHVGVMDMLRFHKFTIGRAWVSDYGDITEKEHFENLLRYSPLHNVHTPSSEREQYPATLVLTADHDDRVSPLHSLKFMAALHHAVRDSKYQKNPLLLRVYSKAGHGMGKPTAKKIEESTDILTFIYKTLKLKLTF